MTRWLSSGVLVLLYHRVAEPARDPWALSISPARFEEQLEVLKRCVRCIRLDDLPENLGARLFQRPRVAVTFDDGYADNLHHAAPLLAKHEIPATVFVVSGAVRQAREFLWDELERVVFESNGSGQTRRLVTRDRTLAWSVPDNPTQVTDGWQAWRDAPPTEGHRVYRELYDVLSNLAPEQQRRTIDDWLRAAEIPGEARPSHRPLTQAELRELAEFPFLSIGAHTVSHPVLARLDIDLQRREIVESREELASITGKTIHHFSYPYGKREHYDEGTVQAVRQAGFASAFTNQIGIATNAVDRLTIPRIVAPSCGGPEFETWLNHCLGGRLRSAS